MRTFLPCSRSISTKYWSCQPRIKFSTVNQTREMFPWRERSQWKSTFQSMCRYGITRFYFYVLDYNVEDFLKTTEAVFRLATDSVFQLSKQNENSKKDEVLYEDLRNHFSATIDNYVAKHPNHIVHYHLNNIMRSRFLTGEIVWYSADYFRMDHLLQKVDGGTVNLYFVPELIPREAYELLGKDGPPLDRSLMRIWIEYDCEGSSNHFSPPHVHSVTIIAYI